MSPELVDPAQPGYSFGNDIWAVGIILYFLLYGFGPFDSNEEEVVVSNILKARLRYPEEDTISKEAKDLLRRILRRDPRTLLNN
jgi:serine/threonine protein kinase